MKKRIIIATTKSWNIANAMKLKDDYSDEYDILLITNNPKVIRGALLPEKTKRPFHQLPGKTTRNRESL